MQQFERHSKVDIGVVFDAIANFVETHEIDLNDPSKIHGGTTAKNRNRVEINGVPVRVASLRLLTFFKTASNATAAELVPPTSQLNVIRDPE